MIESLLTGERLGVTNDILYNLLSTIPSTIKTRGTGGFLQPSHVAVSRQRESSLTHGTAASLQPPTCSPHRLENSTLAAGKPYYEFRSLPKDL